jgi:hypothetical protein
MAGVQPAQRLGPVHGLTGSQGGPHRLVGGAQPAGMVHADHTPAGHPPGERDHAVAGRAYRLALDATEVDATVSRQPRQRRRCEPAQDGRHRMQRPYPPEGHDLSGGWE